MIRLLLFFSIFFGSSSLIAKSSSPSAELKSYYASSMHNAFWLQAHGKSSLAGLQFESAYNQAKEAGENVFKLIAIQKLFIWYRMYGSSLNLFLKNPTGDDRIIGEFKPNSFMAFNEIPFESEWGKTPEQAAKVREFMLGVGEVISAVFCATVTTGWGVPIAYGLALDGGGRIFCSLNHIWASHQAMIALKEWEQGPLKNAQKQ